ncbi:MAG: DUF167 domain-containing protein [Chloroflexota bacterium]|jgi:uncharacterized protein YggU (UPF0235/DUF167 family)|nr:DUF167 domain-containing protein [Anaerolineae bacterium]HMM26818.1 DUF167 domain-containing protein [Aggregatilineaceae bacterium]
MPRKFNITDAQHGAAIAIRVESPAERAEVAGLLDDGSLIVRVTEPPGDDRADEQLIEVVADLLEIEPDRVEIVVGHGRPSKIVSVRGVSTGWVEARLKALF